MNAHVPGSANRIVARFVAALVFGICSVTAVSADIPTPRAPVAWVTDNAGFLSRQTVESQNERLRSYERETGHQVLVYVTPTTGGTQLEDWTLNAFEHWRIGRKTLDDGLVLFIFPKDRKLRIEVGYGLESAVPDDLAARIIREKITPALKAGQPDRAVTAGIDGILGLIGGDVPDDTTGTGMGDELMQKLVTLLLVAVVVKVSFIVIALIIIGIVALRSPALAVSLMVNIFGRGGPGWVGGIAGGGFGGGGAFSGGGGGGGGGGASGSW